MVAGASKCGRVAMCLRCCHVKNKCVVCSFEPMLQKQLSVKPAKSKLKHA